MKVCLRFSAATFARAELKKQQKQQELKMKKNKSQSQTKKYAEVGIR